MQKIIWKRRWEGDTKGSAEAFPEQVLVPSLVKFLFPTATLSPLIIISHLFAGLAWLIIYQDTVLYRTSINLHQYIIIIIIIIIIIDYLLFKPKVLYSMKVIASPVLLLLSSMSSDINIIVTVTA